jgi:hypothetical protein
VAKWLASVLQGLPEQDLRPAPADLEQVLGDAFSHSFDGRLLTDAVIGEVDRQSAGRISLQYTEPDTFLNRIRGPAAYLLLDGTTRVILSPNALQPVQFDS